MLRGHPELPWPPWELLGRGCLLSDLENFPSRCMVLGGKGPAYVVPRRLVPVSPGILPCSGIRWEQGSLLVGRTELSRDGMPSSSRVLRGRAGLVPGLLLGRGAL